VTQEVLNVKNQVKRKQEEASSSVRDNLELQAISFKLQALWLFLLAACSSKLAAKISFKSFQS
jgi:hypothetical protein